MKPWQQQLLRAIPPVNEVLATATVQALLVEHHRDLVTEAVAMALGQLRKSILESDAELAPDLSPEGVAAAAAQALADQMRPHLGHVVNATGVVLHTNLGRAPLALAAMAQIAQVGARYSNLELDVSSGERGSRYSHVSGLLCRLTGAEAALVVNNNAAAVLLMLTALCRDQEVVVSRGELVEIGGSFRVPEVMAAGGARLVEVGTTNKTHRRDYEAAITSQTGAILKVHTSNYRIVGFTESVGLAELAELAHDRGLPLLVDWGSGVMADLGDLGGEHETTMPELLNQGADLVTFSGDKLLGGPQAGFIIGRRALVERLARHPLTRALRIDKLTLAGMEATLRLYLDPDRARREVPALHMLRLGRAELAPVAQDLAAKLQAALQSTATVVVVEGYSQSGGGSLPGAEIPTVLVSVQPAHVPVHTAEARLRAHAPPVLARVHRGQLLIDPRTLWADEADIVVAACHQACNGPT